ncbi:helix-turn-helix domain-containing protein [Serratia marcescens]|uniref:helix-turn-helix domain-containing protein n=1 Tax=Serratia marcescens TaxID=615 RepID=UPI00356B67E8
MPDGSDWHRADIIAALRKRGTSLARVSRDAGLNSRTLNNALDRPWPKGEKLIAEAIGVAPALNAWGKDDAAEQAFNADQAGRKKTALMATATEQIAVLNFAIDRGVATDSEVAKLSQWEEYRLELNRLDTSAATIVWPTKP